MPPREEDLVSVVVPTRNSARTLRACLESVRKQSWPDVELIVVDALSTDETPSIAREHGRLLPLDSERSTARNAGAREARGAFLLFIDSDMALDPGVVEDCVRLAREGNDAVIVPEVGVGEGYWAACRALEKACYVGDDDIEAARFTRRDLFLRIGGYDETLQVAGDDWDLHQRLVAAGARVARCPSVIRHDEGRLKLVQTARKKFYYGTTLRAYRRRHAAKAKRQLRVIRPAFLRNWRLLARRPLHAGGLVVLKSAEFLAGGLGYAWAAMGRGAK